MSSSFCSWGRWTKQEGWVNLRFHLSTSGVNQVEWERELCPIFPFVNLVVWDLLLRRTAARWHNLVCVQCYWGLMLLWVMGAGFDNTCAVSGKWNVSRVIPRLYRWVYKTVRLSPLVIEHDYGFPIKTITDWIPWVANFRFPFYEICVQNQWGHKMLRPSWELRHWRSEFNYR